MRTLLHPLIRMHCWMLPALCQARSIGFVPSFQGRQIGFVPMNYTRRFASPGPRRAQIGFVPTLRAHNVGSLLHWHPPIGFVPPYLRGMGLAKIGFVPIFGIAHDWLPRGRPPPAS